VFAGNPSPFAVNGSLWTLAIEIFCYGALALAACAALRRPWLAVAFAVALFALGETSRAFVEALPRDERSRRAWRARSSPARFSMRGAVASVESGRRGGASRRDSARRGIALHPTVCSARSRTRR
jgi:peptidoglycan/LPS O-acetylase OafA/YrhL